MPKLEKRKAKSFSAKPSIIKNAESMAKFDRCRFSEFIVRLIESEASRRLMSAADKLRNDSIPYPKARSTETK